MFRSLIKKLRRYTRGQELTLVERAIVEAISRSLPVAERRILECQIEAIAKIQRYPDGVAVNFYMRSDYDHRCEAHPPPKFSELEDFVLARAAIALPAFGATLDADISCVSGHLFSIEYKGSVRYFDEAVGMEPYPGLTVRIECVRFAS